MSQNTVVAWSLELQGLVAQGWVLLLLAQFCRLQLSRYLVFYLVYDIMYLGFGTVHLD